MTHPETSAFPSWWPTADGVLASSPGLWEQTLAAVDPRQLRPQQAPGIVSKELDDASGRHFILKNPRLHTYARLSPEEFWLWERMDGDHTVEQLVMDYFMQYHAFAFAAVVGLA